MPSRTARNSASSDEPLATEVVIGATQKAKGAYAAATNASEVGRWETLKITDCSDRAILVGAAPAVFLKSP